MDVIYARESYPDFGPEEFVDLLVRSTLAERRPVGEPGTSAACSSTPASSSPPGSRAGWWASRAITDFSYCTYLSDLAVDRDYQRHGIGKELIRLTHEAAGLGTMLILLAAPLARTYYPHIGMNPHDSCWIIPRTIPGGGQQAVTTRRESVVQDGRSRQPRTSVRSGRPRSTVQASAGLNDSRH